MTPPLAATGASPGAQTETGLLLLTGGRGSRMGVPKHLLDHPAGGTWGGHLVRVFASVCPKGPICVLGEPLPDWPTLPRLDDPRQGPAVALRTWSGLSAPAAQRWWVVACDQVRWTPTRLGIWLARAAAVDPDASHWVLARHQGHLQPLGSLLPAAFRPRLADMASQSLLALVEPLPHLILDLEGNEWLDVDTPEARKAFEKAED